MLRPKGVAPSTRISMEKKGADAYVAHLDPQTSQPVSFRWRLDDSPWTVTKDVAITLDHQPNGAHVLQVTAVDDQLNMEMPSQPRRSLRSPLIPPRRSTGC